MKSKAKNPAANTTSIRTKKAIPTKANCWFLRFGGNIAFKRFIVLTRLGLNNVIYN